MPGQRRRERKSPQVTRNIEKGEVDRDGVDKGARINIRGRGRIHDPIVAGQAVEDFRRLLQIAKPMSELNY